MRSTYRRLRNWQDRADFGTDTIQTSGNLFLTGQAILTQDYTLHSYQAIEIGAGGDGQFNLEISNDGLNYTTIAAYDIGASGVAYSDTWTFAYARPSITGTAGNYLINERHLA